MNTDWLVILGVTVCAMIWAMLWFWPLFWKLWMKIHGWENLTKDQLKKKEEWIWKLLVTEVISTFIMISILAFFLSNLQDYSPFLIALLIWGWFHVPNHISWVIWGGDKKEYYVLKISILSGFSLWVLIIASYLLSLGL